MKNEQQLRTKTQVKFMKMDAQNEERIYPRYHENFDLIKDKGDFKKQLVRFVLNHSTSLNLFLKENGFPGELHLKMDLEKMKENQFMPYFSEEDRGDDTNFTKDGHLLLDTH